MKLKKIDPRPHFKKLVSVDISPNSIAKGFAVGTFIAMLPFFGFGPIIALFVVLFFKKINKISLFGAFLVWNPIFMIPFYYFYYKLGDLIFWSTPALVFNFTLLNAAHHLSKRFLVGSVFVALVVSVFSYFLVRFLAERYQKRKAKNAID